MEIIKQLADKLCIAERLVPAAPACPASDEVSTKAETTAAESTEEETKLSEAERAIKGHKAAIESSQALASMYTGVGLDEPPQMIIVDDDDEAHPLDVSHLPLACAVETKILKGADNRLYILEAARITPRDANYVPAAQGGTGKLPEEYLERVDAYGVSASFLLRKELIDAYAGQKMETGRRALLNLAIENVRKAKGTTATDAVVPAAGNAEEAAKTEAKDFTEAELTVAYNELLRDPANVHMVQEGIVPLNVNCFMPFPCDANEEVAKSDEAVVRSISEYLYDNILPRVTAFIYNGNCVPLDGAAVVEFLHSHGVNLRYMGRLAVLAQEQEMEDVKMVESGRRRMRGMPFYWLELLETEMIARAFKILMNKYMRSDESIRSAPVRTIVSMLNAILGGQHDASAEAEENKNGKSKGKKAKNDAHVVSPNAARSREEFLAELAEVIELRYNYKLTLLHGAAPAEPVQNARLLTRPSLLRRICQLAGIQIAGRPYAFGDGGYKLVADPMVVDDIVAMVPMLKGDGPMKAQPIREIAYALKHARTLVHEEKFEEALFIAQEAATWIGQVIDISHLDAVNALDVLVAVMVRVGDLISAIAFCEKKVSVLIEIGGFDGADLHSTHYLLGTLKLQMGDSNGALKHLICAKYLTTLLGGSRHAELIPIEFQLASIYKKHSEIDESLKHYVLANQLTLTCGSADQRIIANLFREMAEVVFLAGDVTKAIQLQKESYKIAKQLYQPEDEECLSKKADLEKYIRAGMEKGEMKAIAPAPAVAHVVAPVVLAPAPVVPKKVTPTAAPVAPETIAAPEPPKTAVAAVVSESDFMYVEEEDSGEPFTTASKKKGKGNKGKK